MNIDNCVTLVKFLLDPDGTRDNDALFRTLSGIVFSMREAPMQTLLEGIESSMLSFTEAKNEGEMRAIFAGHYAGLMLGLNMAMASDDKDFSKQIELIIKNYRGNKK